MKKLAIFIFSMILLFEPSFGQDSLPQKTFRDSVEQRKRDSLSRAAGKAGNKPVAVANQRAAAPVIDTANKGSNCATCPPVPVTNRDFWVFVLAPIWIFLVLGLLLSVILRRGAFKLEDALAENEYPTIIKENEQYKAANLKDLSGVQDLSTLLPPTIEVSDLPRDGEGKPVYQPNYRPSISRFIALLTSVLTIIVALCMTSFFIYEYLHTGCPPNLSAMSAVLIALGVGVVPYAFNKVSSAIISNQKED